MAFVLFWS